MSVVDIRVNVDTRGIEEVERRLRGGIPRTMRAVAETLAESASNSFATETDPWGNRWPEHTDATLEIYERGGLNAKTRSRSGRRSRSRRRISSTKARTGRRSLLVGPSGQLRKIRVRSGPFIASVGAGGQAAAYARVHQFGNPKNRLPNRQGGAKAPIPARPFLPLRLIGGRVVADLPQPLEDEIRETIRDGLMLGDGA